MWCDSAHIKTPVGAGTPFSASFPLHYKTLFCSGDFLISNHLGLQGGEYYVQGALHDLVEDQIMKKLWFTLAAVSGFGLLLGLWVLPSGAGNPTGNSGLLIALVALVPICLLTMHRLRLKAFKE